MHVVCACVRVCFSCNTNGEIHWPALINYENHSFYDEEGSEMNAVINEEKEETTKSGLHVHKQSVHTCRGKSRHISDKMLSICSATAVTINKQKHSIDIIYNLPSLTPRTSSKLKIKTIFGRDAAAAIKRIHTHSVYGMVWLMDVCASACIYEEVLDVHDRADSPVFIIFFFISLHFDYIILFFDIEMCCIRYRNGERTAKKT